MPRLLPLRASARAPRLRWEIERWSPRSPRRFTLSRSSSESTRRSSSASSSPFAPIASRKSVDFRHSPTCSGRTWRCDDGSMLTDFEPRQSPSSRGPHARAGHLARRFRAWSVGSRWSGLSGRTSSCLIPCSWQEFSRCLFSQWSSREVLASRTLSRFGLRRSRRRLATEVSDATAQWIWRGR